MMKTLSAEHTIRLSAESESMVSHTITIQHRNGNNPRLYRMVNGNWQEMVMVPRWIEPRDIPEEVVDKFERLAKAMRDIL